MPFARIDRHLDAEQRAKSDSGFDRLGGLQAKGKIERFIAQVGLHESGEALANLCSRERELAPEARHRLGKYRGNSGKAHAE